MNRYWSWGLGVVIVGGLVYVSIDHYKTKQAARPLYSTVQVKALFADEGPLYMSPQEPTPTQAVTVTLRSKNRNLTGAKVHVMDTVTHATQTIEMMKIGEDANGNYEFWQGEIPASKDAENYYFEADAEDNKIFYNGYGATKQIQADGNFQITPGFTTPSWAQKGVMYQIFPDRFANGDPSNDVQTGEYTWEGNPTVKKPWGADPETGDEGGEDQTVFFGGDLEGINQKLNYVMKRLGANILYLNPIFTADTNHRYDTTNYFQVDPHLGGNQALSQLTSDLHADKDNAGQQGRILLDGVFNHIGSQSPWFQDALKKGPASPYYNWFTFHPWPSRYATFAGVKNMPKLNYASVSLRNEIYAGLHSVAQTYLKAPYNIDGWRLDAAGHLGANGYDPESAKDYSDKTNHAVWRGFRKAVKGVNPNALIVGEWFENSQATPWLEGDQWDGSINYNGFLTPVSEWITGYSGTLNGRQINVSTLDKWLHSTLNQVPRPAQLVQVNQLSTHDVTRFAERAADKMNIKNYPRPGGGTFQAAYGGKPNIWKDALGAVMQMTYVGLPTIYYGDEYGMMGGGTNDAGKRWTFDWSKVSGKGDAVFQVYQKLIQIRHNNSALVDGSFMTLLTDDKQKVYAYARMDAKNRIIVILNNSGHDQTVTVPVADAGVVNGSTLQNITPELEGVSGPAAFKSDASGNIKVTVHANYALILKQAGSPLVAR